MKKTTLLVIFILIAFVSQTTYLTACKFLTCEETPWSEPAPFSYAIPESQDMSAEALGELADIAQGYVEDERIVGAELMVLKNR